MRRNCNLELQLLPISVSDHYHGSQHHDQPILMETGKEKGMENSNYQNPQQKQQLTIFYNGRVCVCDVTELQARAILMLATREMEEKLKSPIGSEVASPTLPSQLCSPTTSLSMKRSIQRFLQKRNHRIQATSPYNH